MTQDNQPSRQVLEDVPSRALKFLTTVSQHAMIRGILESKGYNNDEHKDGWDLLLKATGYTKTVKPTLETGFSEEVHQALLAVDAWDEPNFRIIRAVLERKHPTYVDFVLKDISAAQGAASVLGVSTLLDRLDELDNGTERRGTRTQDRAVLQTLARSGITPEERQRLRELIKVIRKGQASQEPSPQSNAGDNTETDALESHRQLYSWYKQWSEIARASIQRRDYLILLGLAKRKAKKSGT